MQDCDVFLAPVLVTPLLKKLSFFLNRNTRIPEEFYRVWCAWVWSWSFHYADALAHAGLSSHKQNISYQKLFNAVVILPCPVFKYSLCYCPQKSVLINCNWLAYFIHRSEFNSTCTRMYLYIGMLHTKRKQGTVCLTITWKNTGNEHWIILAYHYIHILKLKVCHNIRRYWLLLWQCRTPKVCKY
jgi:hypothetical protein